MAAVPISSGSFGANRGGGGSPLSQALQRRGMDEGILNQVTAGANSAPERGLPQPVGAGASPVTPALPPQGQPNGLPTSESMTLVKALDSRLKTLGKLQESGIQV